MMYLFSSTNRDGGQGKIKINWSTLNKVTLSKDLF